MRHSPRCNGTARERDGTSRGLVDDFVSSLAPTRATETRSSNTGWRCSLRPLPPARQLVKRKLFERVGAIAAFTLLAVENEKKQNR